MEYFDLYFAWPGDPLAIRSPVVGMKCELDGCDGFFDQYFDACPDQIRFVVLTPQSSGPLVPTGQAAFEALPFVEARVITRGGAGGKIEITNHLPLGEWMRSVALPDGYSLANLPIDEPSARERYRVLSEEVKVKKWALWTASRRKFIGPPWTTPHYTFPRLSAICVFISGTEVRCLVLKDNSVSSLIFRINES
jgi:hypothetical protein